MTTTEPRRESGADVLAETGAVSLGDVDPARSRHAGRRSAVALVEAPDAETSLAVAGLADGSLVAVAPDGTERWRHAPEDAGSVVTLVPFADGVLVGERGTAGTVRYHDGATGERRWRHESATDVGDPQRDSRFYLPFVASAATARVDSESRAYVAVRRYERSGDDDQPRHFESVVYAFTPDGEVAWRYRADASPIAVDARDGRVAVAYNRCPDPDAHDDGLVVLDAGDGGERWRWDPGTAMAEPPGQRRVGDVSLTPDGPVVASHADYRGYALDRRGDVRWQLDLARPVERATEEGTDTVYAYPNHVHATDSGDESSSARRGSSDASDGALFVTGNTYPEAGRETEARHPREHTAVGVRDGVEEWSDPVGGFATGLGAAESCVAVPSAQHFRDRDAATHAVRTFDLADGPTAAVETDGIVTCAAVANDGVAAVEEPVIYHDEGVEHGAYRLWLFER
ncbi:PQQ-binding-like beta-propeller repeat protein [Haloglomus halophilum]|uniref:outer membrane protein assembly factor BamB family protein n=1 Tax=Haloglomus halophilum TaxID=2962672 RepID=UPI0020CA20FB|nr:PQQ-binding-like beta-propeller repeat protein [Haloglomus halophilum]